VLSLDTRFTLTMPEGTLSDTGRALIITYINSQKIREGLWKELNPETPYSYLSPLSDEWAWVWVVTEKGDYVGTFPKRVSKFYRQEMKLKCPPEFIQEIGNIARAHSGDAITYDFEFVNKIEWDAGDFGDDGSCWWGDYEEAKPLLLSNGGLAIRFYQDNAGLGRAWVVPVGEMFIVFNGYGFSSDSTLIIARVMAEFLGVMYKKISLINHNDLMYINNDAGYILGQYHLIREINHHQLGFGTNYEEESSDAS
jgi:hypothetical protein